MYLFQIFRSFQPLHNPIGFGAVDFVVLALAVLMAGLLVARAAVQPALQKITERTPLCMLVLGSGSILLRLALLGHCPVPVPSGADDFSYILSGDTLRHLRLANPVHPVHQFFESIFVLQEPTYSSIYPLGQGLALALGRIISGSFWTGVLLSSGALAALCFWALRGWITAGWALIGGLLAVIEFGPLNQWTNSYWGGALSASAGCLVFGALPRLNRTRRARYAAALGLGLSLQLVTRPFECLLLTICAGLYLRRYGTRMLAVAAIAATPGVMASFLQNRAVTGEWTTLPYMLSRYQYGVPTTFTFQSNPIPHRPLTPEQSLDYRAQAAIHGLRTDTVQNYLGRLGFRVRYLRFFWYAPLYLAVLCLLPSLRERRSLWMLASFLIFWSGTNFYPYFFPHYVAALTPLLLLAAVAGMQQLNRWSWNGRQIGNQAVGSILLLCGVQFCFWYGIQLAGNEALLPVTAYETWDFVNYGDPEGRAAIRDRLAQLPGEQLVLVRYGPQHRFHEWIHNEADIDAAHTVWAADLGAEEDAKLLRYYPHRKVWLLEPDARPPRLAAYETSLEASHPFQTVN